MYITCQQELVMPSWSSSFPLVWRFPFLFTFDLRDAWKTFEGFPRKSAMKAYMFLQNQLHEADPTKKTSDELIKENTDSQQMASVQSMFAQPVRYTSFPLFFIINKIFIFSSLPLWQLLSSIIICPILNHVCTLKVHHSCHVPSLYVHVLIIYSYHPSTALVWCDLFCSDLVLPDRTGSSEEWVAGEQSDLFKAVVEQGAGAAAGGGVEQLRVILDSGVDPSLTDSEVGGRRSR